MTGACNHFPGQTVCDWCRCTYENCDLPQGHDGAHDGGPFLDYLRAASRRLRRTGSAYGYHNQTLEDEDGRELVRLRADNARLRALVDAGIHRALERISEEQIAAALAALADPPETTRQEAARSMLADMRGEYEG